MGEASALTIRAGSAARRTIFERGFDRDAFSTLIGASGGPKWLVLSRLDRVLAEHVVRDRRLPLHTLGSSIGTFRHVCLAQRDPLAAVERLEQAYIGQRYDREPTPAEVTAESRRIVAVALGSAGREEILTNELVRTHVVAVRSRLATRSDAHLPLSLGLGAAAVANAANRSWLAMFFDRVVFSTGAPVFGFRGFGTHHVRLTTENFEDAVVASGAIPLAMAAVPDVAGAPPGRYRDGGIVDYHFDFTFDPPDGLVLYPHFFDRITPGWFDKALSWRRPARTALDRVVMVSPSRAFVASLPHGRVPDRKDFRRFSTEQRQRYWWDVVDRCKAMADELAELLETGRIVDRLEGVD